VNSWNVIAFIALVVGCPVAARAQSIIESETTRVTLSSVTEAPGRVVLTASVVTDRGVGVPGGTIQFIDEDNLAVLGWADVARPSITVDNIAAGMHRFRAVYSGSADYLPLMIQSSQSATLHQRIRAITDIAVTFSAGSTETGALITLTATLTSPAGVPTGSVMLRNGSKILASHVGLDRSGIASFTTSALGDGVRSVTAQYAGDALHEPARSEEVMVDVGAVRIVSSQLRAD
jgi:hypothetical protein